MIPNHPIYQVIVEHMNLSLIVKEMTKLIIIHRSTNVTIQVIDMLPTTKKVSKPNTINKFRHNNRKLIRYNKINFNNKTTEDFKDMNMVLNKTKHIIQQRAGYKDKHKLITIYMDK